ncbi:MAG TPA: gamma-glutamylcyclotransferase family protein [Clostridia bacterium]|nr:gamma-glutamylcyclotransferase family protein [Clostridia bacterium]
MKLQRLRTETPDFDKLGEMTTAMKGLLDDDQNTLLTFEELCSFQDSEGSFKLFESYDIPSDARADFCHKPTYIGAAILMKHYLAEKQQLFRLESALAASLRGGLSGHGYDAERARIEALNIFINGGLREFLETQREICPEFHQKIHNILHEYRTCLFNVTTRGVWGEDYRTEWQNIVDKLHMSKRLYVAYGSNMDKSQMMKRCREAVVAGSSYLENWELTLPFYANIEPAEGKKTPVLLWEITDQDEERLDKYEGYPKGYDKTEIIVNLNGKHVTAMAYVMTEDYKQIKKQPREGYENQILQGYRNAGFSEEEFRPRPA